MLAFDQQNDPFGDIPITHPPQSRAPVLSGAPMVGPPRMPPAQTPDQARVTAGQAAQAPFEVQRSAAQARREQIQLQQDQQRAAAGPAGNANEAQGQAAGFYQRALLANRLYGPGVAPRGVIGQAAADVLPQSFVNSYMTDADRQRADTFARDFVAATLRRESGAAISPAEYQNQYLRYFPQPGDTPETIHDKEVLRTSAVEALRVQAGQLAGPAAQSVDQQIAAMQPQGSASSMWGQVGAQIPRLATQQPPAGSPPARPGASPPAGPTAMQEAQDRIRIGQQLATQDGAPSGSEERFRLLEAYHNSGAQNTSAWIGTTPDGLSRPGDRNVRYINEYGVTREEGAALEREYQEALAARRGVAELRGRPGADARAFMENQVNSQIPIIGPAVQGWQGLAGPESANALLHGAQDFVSLGLRDEANAGINALTGGGSYDDNLRIQQGMDDFDSAHHFGPRLTGQLLAGGVEAPLAGEEMLTQMGRGAAQGFGYGFGSGRDGFGNRLQSGAASAIVGGTAPPLLNVAGGAVNSAIRRIGGAMVNPVLAAGQRLNVPIPRFMAGGVPTRMAASALRLTPGGVPMERAAGRFISNLGAARDAATANIGTVADTAGAGQAARRGAQQFLDSTADRAGRLFDAVPIRAETPAALTNTRAALGEMTAGLDSNPELSRLLADPQLARFRDALESGGLSWGDMKRFRSMIGERIGQPAVAGEQTSAANLRRLYGALSQDMQATAQAQGPQALRAFNRANQFWRGREARREGLISDILGPDFQRGDEAAFERINRWAAQTGGNSARLGQALRSMPADEADTVRATIFARMGQARAGSQDAEGAVFSPSAFATQWNLMSPRAKSFLIPNGAHRQALNDIAALSSASRQAEQFNNRSMTGLAFNAGAGAAFLPTHPGATLAAAAASYLGGRFLANPAGASWLAQLSRAATSQAVRAQIGRLSAIGARNPAIAQDTTGLRQVLLRAMNDNVAGRAAASGNEGHAQQQNGYSAQPR